MLGICVKFRACNTAVRIRSGGMPNFSGVRAINYCIKQFRNSFEVTNFSYTSVIFMFVTVRCGYFERHLILNSMRRGDMQFKLELTNIFVVYIFFSVAQYSKSSLGRLVVEVCRSLSDARAQWDSSEWVISSSQRPLPTQHTIDTRDESPCP
jgi:hypothetical protein